MCMWERTSSEGKIIFLRVRSVLKGYVLTEWNVFAKWNAALSWTGRWPYRHWKACWNVLMANGPAGSERSGEKNDWYNMYYAEAAVRDRPNLPSLTSFHGNMKYILSVRTINTAAHGWTGHPAYADNPQGPRRCRLKPQRGKVTDIVQRGGDLTFSQRGRKRDLFNSRRRPSLA